MLAKKHVCFLITEDWNFLTHRFDFAVALQKRGYVVSIITRVSKHREFIEQAGISVHHLDFSRGSLNPFSALSSVFKLIKILRKIKPSIVHAVTLQPILYGSIASLLTPGTKIVTAFAGLGYTFFATDLKSRIIRKIILTTLRFTLNKQLSHQIVQNKENQQILLDNRITQQGRITLVPGAGVDLSKYRFTSHDVTVPQIILPARLLHDKGVIEFIEAAKTLHKLTIPARFIVVGEIDLNNPASITHEEMKTLKQNQIIEYWGWRSDIPAIMSRTQIVCLPSYHEGFPKVLLEAAASKCTIVASDIAGCRELVTHEKTGLLVKIKSTQSLVEALRKLIETPNLRRKLSENAYNHVKQYNTSDIVNEDIITIYENILGAVPDN